MFNGSKMKIQHYQNLWNSGKAVLRRKLTALNAYIIKDKRSQINLSCYLKKLKREKNKANRIKEMVKSGN